MSRIGKGNYDLHTFPRGLVQIEMRDGAPEIQSIGKTVSSDGTKLRKLPVRAVYLLRIYRQLVSIQEP